MDVHIVPGVKARNVAEAHRKDLLHQEEFGCNCMTYWIDEERESIFCLIDAPNKAAVEEMHNKAHGLVPNKIIEVSSSVVESFLGRIYDPEEAEITEQGLKVFRDPSYRILLVTNINDTVLLQYKYGAEEVKAILKKHNEVIRRNITQYKGREVEHAGNGFIISFNSAGNAVSAALAIQNEIPASDAEMIGFRISINAGEPIQKSNDLFGDTIKTAQQMCAIAKYFQVALASSVKELIAKDLYEDNGQRFLTLPPQDEALLKKIYNVLEEHWQDPDFDVEEYCKAIAMSKSQLYRKIIALTGYSPNLLIKEYRLEKAKELMKKKYYNISQVTFDSGFTSPSYFTKCFKQKFGMLPMTYVDLLQ